MAATVTVEQGTLQGKACETYFRRQYCSFEGIPYAKPPVGELRFRDPLPPVAWQGTRDATRPAGKAAQMNPSNLKLEGSEDCLYLNVYTPVLPAEKIKKMPVLFFVHGGRYILGYGHYYRPDYFLKNDVVVVTINYRLSIFGFLCLHTPEVPGNAALKDAALALEWVKANIEHFNGDPNNITVFGESSGGGTVTSFLMSDLTDGLFHKVISESATCISDLFMVDEDPVEKAKGIASFLGRNISDVNELYDYLQNASVEDLLTAAAIAQVSTPRIRAYFLPVVEKNYRNTKALISEPPYKVFKENRHKKVPILLGIASIEGGGFVRTDDNGIVYSRDMVDFIPSYLSVDKMAVKTKMAVKRKMADQLERYYFKGKPIGDETRAEYFELLSDAYFNRDIYNFADILCKHSNDVYLYRFDYSGKLNLRTLKSFDLVGATHSDILQYQFYRKVKYDAATREDVKIIDFLSDSWYSFVSNGTPKWSPYTLDTRTVLDISGDVREREAPEVDRIRFWKDITGIAKAKL